MIANGNFIYAVHTGTVDHAETFDGVIGSRHVVDLDGNGDVSVRCVIGGVYGCDHAFQRVFVSVGKRCADFKFVSRREDLFGSSVFSFWLGIRFIDCTVEKNSNFHNPNLSGTFRSRIGKRYRIAVSGPNAAFVCTVIYGQYVRFAGIQFKNDSGYTSGIRRNGHCKSIFLIHSNSSIGSKVFGISRAFTFGKS